MLCAAAGFAATATEVCYDFKTSEYGMTRITDGNGGYNDENGEVLTSNNGVTVTLYGKTRLWKTEGVRFFDNSSFNVTAPEGYTITKIAFWTTGATSFSLPEGAKGSYTTNDEIEIGGEKNKGGIWTGNNPTVTINGGSKKDISTLLIAYEEDILNAAGLSFPQEAYEAELGGVFEQPTLTKATDAAPQYTSSNEEVATVDAETGAITIVTAGSTVITVTTAETATHRAGTTSYSLKVIDPNAPKAWEKVTSLSEISENYDYIVVSQGSYNKKVNNVTQTFNFTYAMNSTPVATKAADVLSTSDITITTNGTIEEITENTAVLTITQKDGKYIFSTVIKDGDSSEATKYLSVSAKNKSALGATEQSYEVSFNNTGNAIIKTSVTDSNKNIDVHLQANPNSGSNQRFAFYTTDSQTAIMLYRKAKELVAASVETPKGAIDGDEVEHDGSYELKGSSKILKFELPEGVNLWYKFEATSKGNTTETEENSGIEAQAEHTPEEGFVKYDHSKGIELKEVGTLTYYAEKDGVTGDKHILTVSGDATAIAEVEAESGVTEWYDLSGRKVAAPDKGVYVRKQGSKVAKIAL